MAEVSVSRGAALVALAAFLDAVLGPYLTFGWVSINLTVLCVVVVAVGLDELEGMLLGFSGGLLTDALGVGAGLFGAGALCGVLAGAIAARVGAWVGRAETSRLVVAQVAAVAVAVCDLIRLAAVNLAGMGGPPLGEFILGGMLPDVLLNGMLALLLGERLLKVVQIRKSRWT